MLKNLAKYLHVSNIYSHVSLTYVLTCGLYVIGISHVNMCEQIWCEYVVTACVWNTCGKYGNRKLNKSDLCR